MLNEMLKTLFNPDVSGKSLPDRWQAGRLISGKRKKSKNLGMGLKFRLPGILTFAFCLLPFTFTNMAFAQGAGKALDFDGQANRYIDCGNVIGFERTDPSTVEAWVKLPSAAAYYMIATKGQGSSPYKSWQFVVEPESGQIYWQMMSNYNTGNCLQVNGNTNVCNDDWHYIAATYDGSSNAAGVKLYVDGASQTLTITKDALTESIVHSDPLRLAQGSGGNFYGTIDEVRIWDVALSEATIREWMCKKVDSSHPQWSHLKGYWRLDEGSGTTAYDQTANDNDGTLINMDAEDWVWSGAALGDASAFNYSSPFNVPPLPIRMEMTLR